MSLTNTISERREGSRISDRTGDVCRRSIRISSSKETIEGRTERGNQLWIEDDIGCQDEVRIELIDETTGIFVLALYVLPVQGMN